MGAHDRPCRTCSTAVPEQLAAGDDAAGVRRRRPVGARAREARARRCPGVELVAAGGMVEALRAIKDDLEVARIRAAAQLADEALERGARARACGAHRARGRVRARDGDAPARRGRRLVRLDRGVGGARRAAARDAARRPDPARRARHDRLGRAPRGLLLGLHADVRDRRGDRRRGARGLRARARARSRRRSTRCARGRRGKELDAVAREIIDAAGHAEHFGHGLGPRRRPGGPRGAAPVAPRRRRRAGGGQRRDGRAGRLRARASSACGSRTSWS